jgi:hypothetical protein
MRADGAQEGAILFGPKSLAYERGVLPLFLIEE